ncbi:hypothetical protein R3P38DRAFT_3185713 [Favolaschia claudopus]|uniref:Uncharacterized protein n=1 Tax=Favolaschia claudopus TaxID=2862362 RepID=A0AAW0C6L1_9AGAR
MSFEDAEFPILDEDEDVYPEMVSPERTRTSSFFANSHDFTIKGGHFAIHNHISAEQAAPRGRPKAFRKINWCDIFLEDNLDVVRARVAASGRCSVLRNVYSAKIEGQQNPEKTVVIYEGDGAKQTWYEDISKYLRLRLVSCPTLPNHINIIDHRSQTPSCFTTVRVIIFCWHVDLVPIECIAERYRHEPITGIYFFNFLIQEYDYHAAELARMLQVEKLTTCDDCSLWLNTAGQLCIELGRCKQFLRLVAYSANCASNYRQPLLVASTELIPGDQFLEIIENLTLQGFYKNPPAEPRFYVTMEKGTSAKVRPGSVIGLRLPLHEKLTVKDIQLSLLDQYASRDVKEVAFLHEGCSLTLSIGGQGSMMQNGWIRAKIPQYIGTRIARSIQTHLKTYVHSARALLASQAAYISNHTQNYSPLNFYFMVTFISIGFALMPTRKRTRLGGRVSLFLPPAKDYLSSDGTRLQYSNQAPYWSFHPSGDSPLAPEEAATLGLPSVETKILIIGIYYSPQFYESIAQFYRHKGFGPASQDVAREMVYPLYHLVDDETDPVQQSPLDFSAESWEEFSSDSESNSEDDSEDSSLPERSIEAESEGASDGDVAAVNEGPEPESDDEQILYPRANGF